MISTFDFGANSGDAGGATGVEAVARSMDAAQPLHWQGDGVTLFLTGDKDDPAPRRGFRAARQVWERLTVDLGVPVVSSMQAMAWKGMRLAGVNTRGISGFGRLFQAAD